MYRYVFIMLKIVLGSYLIFLIIYILSEKKINNIHTTFVYRYIRIVFLCLCIYINTYVQNKPHIIYKLSIVNCFTQYTGAQNLCIYITFLLNKPHIIYKLCIVNCFTQYTGAQNLWPPFVWNQVYREPSFNNLVNEFWQIKIMIILSRKTEYFNYFAS